MKANYCVFYCDIEKFHIIRKNNYNFKKRMSFSLLFVGLACSNNDCLEDEVERELLVQNDRLVLNFFALCAEEEKNKNEKKKN